LVPETVSIQAALEAQRHHGMVQTLTPNHSPVMMETEDHFDSLKSSSHSIGLSKSGDSVIQHHGLDQVHRPKPAKTDFFAKKESGNVNFLLNSSSGGQMEDEIVVVSDN
jgi:hypothetical protein